MKNISTLLIVIATLQVLGCDANTDKGGSMRAYGYQGNPELWVKFLRCWTDESLFAYSTADGLTEMEKIILEQKNQGFPPATREQIADKERELSIEFPKSYKDFLLASNGWLQPFLDKGDGLVLPVRKVSYFSDFSHQFYSIVTEVIDDRYVEFSSYDPEYVDNQGDYTEKQDSSLYDNSHFINSIAISDHVDSGIYLINVHKKTPENEWEIWFYSSNHPGTYRFVSFAHLMQSAYLRTTGRHGYYGPAPIEKIEGTCAEILGYPKIK